MSREYARWQDIPADRYYTAALTLSAGEGERLGAALAVLPERIVDAHAHVARCEDLQDLSADLLGHVVSTFPVYSLEMAEAAKRVLWHGKQVRSARMAHAVAGYRHAAINAYLRSDLPTGDFFIAFGLASSPSDVHGLLSGGGIAALKMYFRSVDPPLRTAVDVFPEPALRVAEAASVPILLHLPTSLPDGLEEVRDLATRHPLLPIILAHLGGHGGQTLTPQLPAAFRAIAELPTVYMDTAFVFDRDLLHAAVHALGPSRILFGTDEPLSLIRATGYVHPRLGPRLYAPEYHWSTDDDPPAEVTRRGRTLLHIEMLEAIIDATDGDQQILQAIFHDNALRLFERALGPGPPEARLDQSEPISIARSSFELASTHPKPRRPNRAGDHCMDAADMASSKPSVGVRPTVSGNPVESPLVSIVIPTYNHAHYLPESVGSVLSQSYSPLELIVVDDGSRDETQAVVQRCGGGVARYVSQRNRGLAAARNLGLSMARGELVAFLDADDRLLPDHLRVSVAAVQDHADVAFVCGDLCTFGPLDDFVHTHACAPTPDHFASMLRGCFIVNVGACLFRRPALLAVGGFDETCNACEDWDLFFRLLRHSPLYCHHTVVLEYRRSPGQMSRDFQLMLGASMRVLRDQRSYARSRAEYAEAYEEGLADIRRYYGDPAADALRRALSQRKLLRAARLSMILLRWYPAGLLRAAQPPAAQTRGQPHAS